MTQQEDGYTVEQEQLKIVAEATVKANGDTEETYTIPEEKKPDAVTQKLADAIWEEYLIDVRDHEIDIQETV